MVKEDLSVVSYVLGLVSLVLAFFTPFAGLVLGIIGITMSSKQKTELSKKGKRLSIIAIVVSVVLIVALIIISIIGYSPLENFPIQ